MTPQVCAGKYTPEDFGQRIADDGASGVIDGEAVSYVVESPAPTAAAESARMEPAGTDPAGKDTGNAAPDSATVVDGTRGCTDTQRLQISQLFDVLLLSSQPSGDAPERGTNLVAETSVPDALRQAVVDSQRESWTYTEIQFLDGRSTPGLVVGAPLLVPTVGPYELYYLFPLYHQCHQCHPYHPYLQSGHWVQMVPLLLLLPLLLHR